MAVLNLFQMRRMKFFLPFPFKILNLKVKKKYLLEVLGQNNAIGITIIAVPNAPAMAAKIIIKLSFTKTILAFSVSSLLWLFRTLVGLSVGKVCSNSRREIVSNAPIR